MENTTYSYNSDQTELTLKRENATNKPNYELVYDVATGSIKSGKLTKGTETVNISANSIVKEESNGYITVQSGDDLFISSSSLVEINETLNLTYEQYTKVVEALAAYNTGRTSAMTLSDITVVTVSSDNTVTFEITKNGNYTENIVYKSSNGSITRQYEIGKQKFNVPKETTISVDNNGNITIRFTKDKITKTIELSKEGESSTYYDQVKYNSGTTEDIDEEAMVTIRSDGQIIK